MTKFPVASEYVPPVGIDQQIVSQFDLMDPESVIDNRDAVHWILMAAGFSVADRMRIARPWHVGFYKVKGVGKSHPLPWRRVPRHLRVLGFDVDIGSVAHDYSYYKGNNRAKIDRQYYNDHIMLMDTRLGAWLEYQSLRLFGWRAWRHHDRMRQRSYQLGNSPLYGTDAMIPDILAAGVEPLKMDLTA